MILHHHLMDHGQAQAVAILARRVGELEDLLLVLLGDAATRVGHLQPRLCLAAAHREGKGPSVRHRLEAVQDQVQDGGSDRLHVSLHDPRLPFAPHLDPDPASLRLFLHEPGRLGGQACQIHRNAGRPVAAREAQEALHQLVEAVDLGANDGDGTVEIAPAPGFGGPRRLLQVLERQVDGMQRVSYIVGHARRHPPQGGELLAAAHLQLPLAPGAQPPRHLVEGPCQSPDLVTATGLHLDLQIPLGEAPDAGVEPSHRTCEARGQSGGQERSQNENAQKQEERPAAELGEQVAELAGRDG